MTSDIVAGLEVGIVNDIDDPEMKGRIRVTLPARNHTTGWAPMLQPAGLRLATGPLRPDIDDEVVVGFLGGDIRHPVVIGQIPESKYRQ